MSDPAPYVVGYSFSGFQSNNPSTPLPANRLDDELARIALAISGLVSAVKDVRRSDGALNNASVNVETLGSGVLTYLQTPQDIDVSVRQMRLALLEQGQLDVVNNGIPAAAEDPINIQWTSGNQVLPGDTLAVAIQALTGFSGTQMTDLFTLARTKEP